MRFIMQYLPRLPSFRENSAFGDRELIYTYIIGVVTGNNSCHIDSASKIELLDDCCFQVDTCNHYEENKQRTRHKRNTPPGNQMCLL